MYYDRCYCYLVALVVTNLLAKHPGVVAHAGGGVGRHVESRRGRGQRRRPQVARWHRWPMQVGTCAAGVGWRGRGDGAAEEVMRRKNLAEQKGRRRKWQPQVGCASVCFGRGLVEGYAQAKDSNVQNLRIYTSYICLCEQ